jgi:hypothetical protein
MANLKLQEAMESYMTKITLCATIVQQTSKSQEALNQIGQATFSAQLAHLSMLQRLQEIGPDEIDQTAFDLAMEIQEQYEIAKSCCLSSLG